MKKLLPLFVLLAFLLLPTSASAQCTGIFGANTACGSLAGGVPGQVPIGSLSGNLVVNTTPITGGPTGCILYDVASVLQCSTSIALTPITSDVFYFVRTDGNDTACTGLTNAAYVSGTFPQNCGYLTLQKAVNTASLTLYIPQNLAAVILIQDGTYTGCTTVNGWNGPGQLFIQGNTTTPDNVVLNTSVACNGVLTAIGPLPGQLTLTGAKLTATASNGLYSTHTAVLYFDNIDFGTVGGGGAHISADFGSQVFKIVGAGTYTISGGATAHWHTTGNSMIAVVNQAITLTGTPAFSGFFAGVAEFGVAFVTGNTYTGSATGPKFLVHNGGLLETDQTISALPGDVPGTLDQASGGIYVGVPNIASITADSTLGTGGYLIANLPTCNAAAIGFRAYVTNGVTSPTFLATVSTTGAVIAPVVCNGTNWIYG